MIDRIELVLYEWLRGLPSAAIGEMVQIEGQLFRPTAGRGYTAARLLYQREDLGIGQNRGHLWTGRLVCDRVSPGQPGMPSARLAARKLFDHWPSSGTFGLAHGVRIFTQSADIQPGYVEGEWAHVPVVFPWLSQEVP